MSTMCDPDPLAQHATRCQVLGIDGTGAEHVYDAERERVVVLDGDGIEYQRALPTAAKPDWMQHVDEVRGWAKEQWVGWRLARAVFEE